MIYELNPNDNSAIFSYLNALVEYYRIDNSIVNPQQMNDAVDLMKGCISYSRFNDERFQFIMAMILTGAGRNAEAALAFEGLMQYRNPDGTSTSLISENELIFSIGESYYNAGNLNKAEECFNRLQSMGAGVENASIMLKKIVLKRSGIR